MPGGRRDPWLAALAQAIAFGVAAALRLIDADEGYYLLSSQLVLDGAIPYRDFLYPQAPFLPYVYGAWLTLVGPSWYAGRLLSAVLAVVLGLLIFRHVEDVTGRRPVAWTALLLYAGGGLTLGWLTTVKTYALSTALLFGAFVRLAGVGNGGTPRRHWTTGALLGLAVGVRSLCVVTVPLFLFGVWARERVGGHADRAMAWFAGGMAAALAPPLLLLVFDPQTFWFNNLWFHSLRTNSQGLFGTVPQKVAVIRQLFTWHEPGAVEGFQFAVLTVLVIAAARRAGGFSCRLATAIALAIAIVSLLPSPTFTQYFVVAVPFMIVAAVPVLELPALDRRRWGRPSSGAVVLVAVAAYLAVTPLELHRYLVSGAFVPGILSPQETVNWRISTVNRVISEVAARTRPGDRVFASWPGYLVGLRRPRLPRSEMDFGVTLAARLRPDEQRRYRVLSREEVGRHISSRTVRAAVTGDSAAAREYQRLLERSGYVSVVAIGDTRVFLAPGAAP